MTALVYFVATLKTAATGRTDLARARGGDMLDLHDHILSRNPQGLQMLRDLLGEGSEFDEDDLPSDLGEDDDEGSDDDEAWAMESDHDGDDEHEGG